MSELTKRVLFAIPAAALLLWVTWMGGQPFGILFGVLMGVTIWEVHRILLKAEIPDFFLLSILIAAACWSFPLLPLWAIYGISGLLILGTAFAFSIRESSFLQPWTSSLFCGIYAPLGFLMIVYMRGLGDHPDGFWLTITFFLMIWGNDVFAFFGGKSLGKRAMAPSISPQKTWEGFWFGFLGAAIGFLIVFLIADPYPLPLWALVPSIAIVSTLGPAGDITESRLKRIAGVKDSSDLLPGHGGLFDRFDSMILSAPFIYFLYYLIL